jgi:hypothetical protein
VFIPGAALSRKELEGWTERAKKLGAGGLMTLELGGAEPKGSVAKFVPDTAQFAEKVNESLVGATHASPANGAGQEGRRRCVALRRVRFMVMGPAKQNPQVLGQLA